MSDTNDHTWNDENTSVPSHHTLSRKGNLSERLTPPNESSADKTRDEVEDASSRHSAPPLSGDITNTESPLPKRALPPPPDYSTPSKKARFSSKTDFSPTRSSAPKSKPATNPSIAVENSLSGPESKPSDLHKGTIKVRYLITTFQDGEFHTRRWQPGSLRDAPLEAIFQEVETGPSKPDIQCINFTLSMPESTIPPVTYSVSRDDVDIYNEVKASFGKKMKRAKKNGIRNFQILLEANPQSIKGTDVVESDGSEVDF